MKNKTIVRLLTAFLLLAMLGLTACSGALPSAAAAGPSATAAPKDTPAAEQAAPTPAPAETSKLVEAETVEDFLKAIAPDTVIRLTGRSYDLSRALGYGNFSGDYYDWEDLYEGYELVIRGVENLRIECTQPGTEIVTLPSYANVLRFDNCSNITLAGLTVGHTEGAGYCAGAVLHFNSCSDVLVENCDLYGCGTYGLELERCRNLSCRGSVIRNCTYGALNASSCSGIVLDDCIIHGMTQDYTAVLYLANCSGCGLLNSLVRNCVASSVVECSYVQDFYLGGCEIVNNRLSGMFLSSGFPITVDGCAFRGNSMSDGWYRVPWDGAKSERAVDPEGKAYEDDEFYDMQRKKSVSWTPPEGSVPEQKPVEPSDDGMIHVSTVDELLASIAPGVTIYLEDGKYNLADAMGYGSFTGDYYYWMNCYDGPGLVISGADGLTITAGGPHRVTITAEPRYADVISFEGCKDLTLKNFTAGHTQEPGVCSGGVLSFQSCTGTAVQDCSLYGCGIVGISAVSCKDMSVRFTEIHDCSDGAFFFTDCDSITMERCSVHDVKNYTYQIFNSKNITADGKSVPNGVNW